MTRIAIDLGTTRCCVAVVGPDGKAQLVPTRHGERMMPSVVAYGSGTPPLPASLGAAARRQAIAQPRMCVAGVRRLFGRRADEPELRRPGSLLGGGVVAASNGDAWIALGDTTISPPDVAAALLSELRQSAQEHLRAGAPVEAVLTVPPGAGHAARQALRDAAELAGIPVARLLSEAAAAAIGHGASRRPRARLAVCDLGGGRFDASIVAIEGGVVEVLGTAGENVGGDDFDRRIAARLAAEIRGATGHDPESDPGNWTRFLEDAQRVKHAAVDTGQGTLELAGTGGRPPFSRTLKRLEIEGWTRDLVEKLDAPCREALAGARVRPGDIREILVVGGAARLPSVVRKIEQVFGCPAARAPAPDEVVALGAAIYAAALDGMPEAMLALDVSAHALAFRAGGRVVPLVPRFTTLPARAERVLTTVRDGQKEIAIEILEGEGTRSIGRYLVSGFPDGRAGEVLLMCDFTIDGDGLCGLGARLYGGGARPQVRRENTSGLPRAELRRGHA